MSKKKKIMQMVARGGVSQKDIASILHCSKRDVSVAAKIIQEHSLNLQAVESMDAAKIDELFFPKTERAKNDTYLQPDMEEYIRRKLKNKKIPIKLFWYEYCAMAKHDALLAYSYQTFCELFANAAEKANVTAHFIHDPGAKSYIDWAGDIGWLTDKVSGRKTKVYVLILSLPFSAKFYAEGFTDMKKASWLGGHMNAFDDFGGAPHMLIPDNCSTATDRGSVYVTLINKDYLRFAEHYGSAVVPARVRRPRDKSLAEATVNLVEQWIISPSHESTFYTLEEYNEFVTERCCWLNERPFTDKPGCRQSEFEDAEKDHLLPLPIDRFEMCEWRCAKVPPNYHVRIENMHYSVPYHLTSKTCDVKLGTCKVEVLFGGETVAVHKRLHGRRGQYSTNVDHMPQNHQNMNNPWSSERFIAWGKRIGPATGEAIARVIASRPIVEQSFVACRNLLGLSKAYAPGALELACSKIIATPAVPSYTAVKNIILAEKAKSTTSRSCPVENPCTLIDRARDAGLVNGADAYRRGGDKRC